MRHRQPETGHSLALWAPLLWLLLSSVRNRLVPEPIEQVAAFESSPVFAAGFVLLMATGLMILVHRRIDWQGFLHRNLWLAALVAWMGLSILWADYPWISLKRYMKTVGVILMVLVVLTEADPFKAFSALLRRYCYLTIPLSWFLILFVPTYGRRTLIDGTLYWVGVAGHKNNMGLIVLVGTVYFLWLLFCQNGGRKEPVHVVMFAMSLLLLAACSSMTSLFSFFAVIFSLILIRVGRAGARHAGVLMVYLVVVAGMAYFLLDNLLAGQPIAMAVVGLFGRDLTFTGRMDLWQDVWALASQHPLLGHGFGGFWVGERAELLWQIHDWQPVDSHNGYLDIFSEMGVIGAVFAAMLIVTAYRNIVNALNTDFELARLRMMLFIMVLVHNFNETSLCSLTHPYWMIFLLATVSGPRDWAVEERGSAQAAADEPAPEEGLAGVRARA